MQTSPSRPLSAKKLAKIREAATHAECAMIIHEDLAEDARHTLHALRETLATGHISPTARAVFSELIK